MSNPPGPPTPHLLELEVVEMAGSLRFPEGPVALSDGSVLVCEIERGTLSRVEVDGGVDVVAECGGGPNGAAIGPDGACYIANNGGAFSFVDLGGMLLPGDTPAEWTAGSIQRVDLADGSVETLYESCDGRPLRAPNDLVFDGHGGFWFTDHGARRGRSADRTGVFYARADGSAISEVLFPLNGPNGIGLSPDGSRLHVAETYSGCLFSWEVVEPGIVGPAFLPLHAGGTLLYDPGAGALFDSLAVDGAGRVCVAALGHGGIYSVEPDGSGSQFVATGDPLTTNICFGGDDMHTAYITCSGTGRLIRATWPHPGLALPHREVGP